MSQVEIKNYSFQPGMLTVQAGTTVIWTNNDSVAHTITSDIGMFDSGPISPNGQFRYAFIQLGNFSYHCKIHPTMKGTIQVKPVSVAMPSAITFNPVNASFQYVQYYTMNTGTAPNAHISVPQQVDINSFMPNTVHIGNQMQAVPFSQYQTSATPSGSSSLWIKGTTDWTQYAAVPVGSNVPLLAISPAGGSGTLNLMDANGQIYSYNYFFYPNSQLTFYADAPGRHILSYSIGGSISNSVVIDVIGTLTMTYNPTINSNYYPPVVSYPAYYSPFSNYTNPQAALDLADATKAYQKALMNSYYYYGNMPYSGSDWLGGNGYVVGMPYYYNGNDWYYGAYAWLNAP